MKVMKSNRTRKTVIIILLVFCLMSISVGYAIISSDLNISGTAVLDPISFGVELTNIETEEILEDAEVVNIGTIDKTTISNMDLKFAFPGSSVLFKVSLENKGDLDVRLANIDLIIPNCVSENETDANNVCSHIKVIVYDNNNEEITTLKKSSPTFYVNDGNGLISKTSDYIYVRVEYEEESINDLPSASVSIQDFGLFLTYVQDYVIKGIPTENKSYASYGTLKMLGIDQVNNTPIDYNMFNYGYDGSNIFIFNPASTETFPNRANSGIYEIEDDDGISYYYRGNVNTKNVVKFGHYTSDMYYWYDSNNISYNGTLEECNNSTKSSECLLIANSGDSMYWRIIRINGNGSIRLIYDGNGTDDNMGEASYNPLIDGTNYSTAEKYSGYTYDNSSSSIKDGTPSSIKSYLDSWYAKSGISDLDDFIAYGTFFQNTSEINYSESFSYIAQEKVYIFPTFSKYINYGGVEVIPNLKSSTINKTYGGLYSLKIGLTSTDEFILSGYSGIGGVVSNRTYMPLDSLSFDPLGILCDNEDSNCLVGYSSPIKLDNSNNSVGLEFLSNEDSFSVNGVINLSPYNLLLLSGDGSKDNPYIFNVG